LEEETVNTQLDIDPGVRRLVALLKHHNFVTTDSGDGISKSGLIADGLAESMAHVYMSVSPDKMAYEARRLFTVLSQIVEEKYFLGHHIDERLGQNVPNVLIEVKYSPIDNVAVLMVHGIADKHLKGSLMAKPKNQSRARQEALMSWFRDMGEWAPGLHVLWAEGTGCLVKRGERWWASNDTRWQLVGVSPNDDLIMPTVGPFKSKKVTLANYNTALTALHIAHDETT
jgi:hypothetical protein